MDNPQTATTIPVGLDLAQLPILTARQALDFMHDVQHHAVIVEKGRTYVVTTTFDQNLQRECLDYSTLADIKARYANRRVIVGHDKNGLPKYMTLGGWWLENFQRREYQGIVFDPSDAPNDCYLNQWRGFAVKPESGDWSRLEEHLYDIVCRRSDRDFTFLLDCFAAIVKHPDRLTENAIIFQGGEGAGKGISAHSFGSLFAGQHFLPLHHARYLTGQFNSHLATAVVTFLDEAVGFEDRQANASLRSLITEELIFVEAKFKNPIQHKNVCHVFIASNERFVVKAAADARRFFILDVDNKRRGQRPYFAAIQAQMSNGGRAAMLYDLQHRAITTTLSEPPQTTALLDTKLASMDAGATWWHERLKEGQLIVGDSQPWRTEVIRKILTEQYAEALGRGHGKGKATSTELGLLLKKLLPPGYPKEKQRTVQASDRPSWNYFGLKPVERFWVLPSLGDCRKHFDSWMRTSTTW